MKNYVKFFVAVLLTLFIFTPFSLSQAQAPPPKIPANAKPHVRTITAFINLDRAQHQLQFAETAKFLGDRKSVV